MKTTFTKEEMSKSVGCMTPATLEGFAFPDPVTLETVVRSSISMWEKFWFVYLHGCETPEEKEEICQRLRTLDITGNAHEILKTLRDKSYTKAKQEKIIIELIK